MQTAGKQFCCKISLDLTVLTLFIQTCRSPRKTSSIILKESSSQLPLPKLLHSLGNISNNAQVFSQENLGTSWSKTVVSDTQTEFKFLQISVWGALTNFHGGNKKADELCLLLEKNNKYFMHNIVAVVTRPAALSSLLFLIIITESHNPTKLLLILLGWVGFFLLAGWVFHM